MNYLGIMVVPKTDDDQPVAEVIIRGSRDDQTLIADGDGLEVVFRGSTSSMRERADVF